MRSDRLKQVMLELDELQREGSRLQQFGRFTETASRERITCASSRTASGGRCSGDRPARPSQATVEVERERERPGARGRGERRKLVQPRVATPGRRWTRPRPRWSNCPETPRASIRAHGRGEQVRPRRCRRPRLGSRTRAATLRTRTTSCGDRRDRFDRTLRRSAIPTSSDGCSATLPGGKSRRSVSASDVSVRPATPR